MYFFFNYPECQKLFLNSISAQPLPAARLTSPPDLCADKLHCLPDAFAVCDVQQEGLQSGGSCRRQVCCTFLREACGNDLEAFSIQLFGQEIPKAAVTAGDEHMLVPEAIDLVGISNVSADCSHGDQKEN